ncbi:MAG: S24 family peptidase [Mucilaginibacter sp.]
MEKIIDRVYKYLDYQGIPPTRFEKEIGLSNGYLNTQKKREADLGESVIKKIVDNSLDLNLDWLMTGKGQMLKSKSLPPSNAMAIGELKISEEESPYIDLGNGQFLMVVPLIPIKASAGYRENFQDENYINTHYDKHYFPVTRQYRGKYFAFVVDGPSMDNGTSEAIIEGSTVTGRDIQKQHWVNKFHLKSFQDYIIVHKDVILVKRIIEHDTENGTILCHSLNPDKNKHPDFTIQLDECLQILNIVNVTQPR